MVKRNLKFVHAKAREILLGRLPFGSLPTLSYYYVDKNFAGGAGAIVNVVMTGQLGGGDIITSALATAFTVGGFGKTGAITAPENSQIAAEPMPIKMNIEINPLTAGRMFIFIDYVTLADDIETELA